MVIYRWRRRSGGDGGGTDCNSATAAARFAGPSEFSIWTGERISLECQTELDELSMQQRQVGAFEGISCCAGCWKEEGMYVIKSALGIRCGGDEL